MRPKGLNNIVVVGAGSAGWMTALYMKKTVPDCNVTVIGSRELGILGAGEGTVPSIIEFLRYVEIHPYELLRKCKSTVKTGIKFVNWNGDGNYYHHGFISAIIDQRKNRKNILEETPFDQNYLEFDNYVSGISLNSYDYESLCADFLRMPIPKDKLHLYDFKLNAWHVDAIEIAKLFEEIGVSRGIRYIDDYVTCFDQDNDGYITKINMKNGSIDCDFIFDCTGFKRLIIDKLYNSQWTDLSDHLTVNRALPFSLPPKEKLQNYTTATAMNSGWVWEIPLQHRIGCGYIFNSNFCDDETAKKELYAKYGHDIEIPKSFNFNAGYFKETWIKNCIAIGLSSGFIEPMEATSIFGSTVGLSFAAYYTIFLPKAPQAIIDAYNAKMRSLNGGIAGFIQFHYLSKRKDTEFWKDITTRPYLNDYIDFFNYLRYSPPNRKEDTKLWPFNIKSYSRIGMGIEFFDKEHFKNMLGFYKNKKYFAESNNLSKKTMEQRIRLDVERNISHQEFLEMVVGKEQLEENRRLIFK
jgi:tryptophan halogenase